MKLVELVDENPRRKKCGTLCDVSVAPRALRFLLGEPSRTGADHYRVTGEYHFAVTMSSNNKSHVKYVTVHDWEQTTVFERTNPFTVDKFWGIQQQVPLKVSAMNEREAYIIKGFLETAIDCKIIDDLERKPRKQLSERKSEHKETSSNSDHKGESGHFDDAPKKRGRKKKVTITDSLMDDI
jgi:hypothetical protein